MCRINGNLNASLYLEVLQDELLNSLEYYNLNTKSVIFQHDNAPCHKTEDVLKWLYSQSFTYIKYWTPQSPEINPIEHLWDNLKKKLGQYRSPPNGVEELW